eukprot:3461776-Rhodomonas_salina.2
MWGLFYHRRSRSIIETLRVFTRRVESQAGCSTSEGVQLTPKKRRDLDAGRGGTDGCARSVDARQAQPLPWPHTLHALTRCSRLQTRTRRRPR